MTSPAFPLRLALPPIPAFPPRERWIAGAAAAVTSLFAVAVARRLGAGASITAGLSPWLMVHLLTVVPAVPLGGWLLARRGKGDRAHRLLGRLWAVLMMAGALSSFGLTGMLGHLGPIHILSAMVVGGVPLAVARAIRGDIARHRRGMTIMVASSVAAGFFAFLPGRLLGAWLFG